MITDSAHGDGIASLAEKGKGSEVRRHRLRCSALEDSALQERNGGIRGRVVDVDRCYIGSSALIDGKMSTADRETIAPRQWDLRYLKQFQGTRTRVKSPLQLEQRLVTVLQESRLIGVTSLVNKIDDKSDNSTRPLKEEDQLRYAVCLVKGTQNHAPKQ